MKGSTEAAFEFFSHCPFSVRLTLSLCFTLLLSITIGMKQGETVKRQ